MAFGLPNAGDLNGIVNNLGSIVASIGPEESAVLKTAIDQLSDHANALEDKAIAQIGSVIAEDLAPVIEQIAAFNALLATTVGLLTRIVEDGIPLSAVLGGPKVR